MNWVITSNLVVWHSFILARVVAGVKAFAQDVLKRLEVFVVLISIFVLAGLLSIFEFFLKCIVVDSISLQIDALILQNLTLSVKFALAVGLLLLFPVFTFFLFLFIRCLTLDLALVIFFIELGFVKQIVVSFVFLLLSCQLLVVWLGIFACLEGLAGRSLSLRGLLES